MSGQKLLLSDISEIDRVSSSDLYKYNLMCPHQFLYELRVLNTVDVFNIMKHGTLAFTDTERILEYNQCTPNQVLYGELAKRRHFMLVGNDTAFKMFYNIETSTANKRLQGINDYKVSRYDYTEKGILTSTTYKHLLKKFFESFIDEEYLLDTVLTELYNNKLQCSPPLINKSVDNVMLFALYITTRILTDFILKEALENFVFNNLIDMANNVSHNITDAVALGTQYMLSELKQVLDSMAYDMMPSLATFYVLYLVNLENAIRRFGDIDGMSDIGHVCKVIRYLYYLPICDVFMTSDPIQTQIVESLPSVFTEYKDKLA